MERSRGSSVGRVGKGLVLVSAVSLLAVACGSSKSDTGSNTTTGATTAGAVTTKGGASATAGVSTIAATASGGTV